MALNSRPEQLIPAILARQDLSDEDKTALLIEAAKEYGIDPQQLLAKAQSAPPQSDPFADAVNQFQSWESLNRFIASSSLDDETASELRRRFTEEKGLPSAFSQFWRGVASWPTEMATIIPMLRYGGASLLSALFPKQSGLQEKLSEQKRRSIEEIERYRKQREAVFTPAIESVRDIPGDTASETAKRAVTYAAERLGGLAPDALLAAVSGVGLTQLAARQAAKKAGPMVAKEVGEELVKKAAKAAAFQTEVALGTILGQREAAEIVATAHELGEEEPNAAIAEVGGLASGLFQAMPSRIMPSSQAARDLIAHAVFGARSKPYLSKVVVPKVAEVARGAALGAVGGAGSAAASTIALDVMLDRAAVAPREALEAAIRGLEEGTVMGALVGIFSPTGAQYAALKPQETVEPTQVERPLGSKAIKFPKKLPAVQGKFEAEREVKNGVQDIISDQLSEVENLRKEVPTPEMPEGFISPLRAKLGRLISERYPIYKLGEYVEEKLGQTALGKAIRDAADSFNFVTARTQNVMERGLAALQEELAKAAEAMGPEFSQEKAIAVVGSYGMLKRIQDDPFTPILVRYPKEEATKIERRVKRFTGIEPVRHSEQGETIQAFVPRKALEFDKVRDWVEEILPDDLGFYLQSIKEKFPEGNMLKGNPYKLTSFEAQQLLKELKEREPHLYAAAEASFSKLNALRDRVLRYIHERGWISESDYWTLTKNSSYATFVLSPDDVQDSLVEAYISPAIKRRTGWSGAVRNPYVMTVAKLASLMETAERNELATATVLGLHELGLVEKAKPLPGGHFEPPRNPAWELLRVRQNGQEFGFYVPKEFADAVSAGDPTPSGIVKVARFLGNITHALWIRYSPRFAVMNPLRDFRDTITRNPELQTVKGFTTFLKERMKARKEAKAYVRFGVMSRDVADLVERGIVPPGGIVRPASLNSLAEVINRVVPEPDAPPRTLREKGAALLERSAEVVDSLMSPIPTMISTSEMASKLAGARALRKMGVTGRELEYRVRNMVGTPNFMRRGSWALVTNALFPFSTVKLQGMRATYEAFRKAPGRVSRYMLLASGIPTVVRWSLASGAALALYNYLKENGQIEGNEVAEDALQTATAIAERQTRYNLANYDGFPVAMLGDKGLWVRIPMGYAEQIFSSTLYHILDEVYFRDLYGGGSTIAGVAESVAKTFAGEVPAAHPLVTAAADLALLALNVNPPDIFRGGHSIPRHIFDAGGPQRWKYQLTKEARGALGSFAEWIKMPDPVMESQVDLLRTFQDVPGLGNALGSFVRISNFGIIEKIRRMQEVFRQEQNAEYERARSFVSYRAARDVPIYDVLAEAIKEGIIPRSGRPLDWKEIDWLINIYARQLIFMSPFGRAVMMSRSVSDPVAKALMLTEATGLLQD